MCTGNGGTRRSGGGGTRGEGGEGDDKKVTSFLLQSLPPQPFNVTLAQVGGGGQETRVKNSLLCCEKNVNGEKGTQ